ncbi:MAG: hypothetical protein ACOC96_03135 [Actinomycetota bacterium]
MLELFDVTLGQFDLVTLGLALVAAHLAFGISITPWRGRRR